MRLNLHRHGPKIDLPPLDPQAIGLAAVAAELNLQIDTLEPNVGQAVQRGAAALFFAGYGPPSARTRLRRQIDKADRRPKAGRVGIVSSGSGLR